MSGFEVEFDHTKKEIKKAWWRYTKGFSIPRKKEGHYELQLVDIKQEASSQHLVYSSVRNDTSGTYLFVGAKDEKLKAKIPSLIQDFQRTFYVNLYLKELQQLKKRAARISRRAVRNSHKTDLTKLESIQILIKKKISEIKLIEKGR
ncbi:MAG: hypothetical protein AAF789_13435 [Bacteroidota bacterium]